MKTINAFVRMAIGFAGQRPGTSTCGSKLLVLAAAAFLASHLSTTPVQAGTITVTYNGVSPGDPVTILTPINVGTRAGIYNLTVTASTDSNFSPNSQLIAFCIDLSQGVSSGNSYTYTVGDLAAAPVPFGGINPPNGMEQTRADLIRQLWALHITSATTNSGAAAFQLAVWEIINEAAPTTAGDIALYSFGAGNFQAADAVSGAAATAEGWLHGLALNYNGTLADLASLQSVNDQDFVVELPPPTQTHVDGAPAPPGLLLGLVGGLALVVSSLSKLRKRVAAASS